MTVTWSTTNKNANILISNGGLTAAASPTGTSYNYLAGRSDTGFTDKRYWEVHWDQMLVNDGSSGIGMGNASMTLADGGYLGKDSNGAAYYDDGGIQLNNPSAYFTKITAPALGDTICIAVDAVAGKVWFRRNAGQWNDSPTDDPATGTGGYSIAYLGATIYPAYSLFNRTTENNQSQVTANFGATAFAYAVPSGFSGLDAPSNVVAMPSWSQSAASSDISSGVAIRVPAPLAVAATTSGSIAAALIRVAAALAVAATSSSTAQGVRIAVGSIAVTGTSSFTATDVTHVIGTSSIVSTSAVAAQANLIFPSTSTISSQSSYSAHGGLLLAANVAAVIRSVSLMPPTVGHFFWEKAGDEQASWTSPTTPSSPWTAPGASSVTWNKQ